MSRHNVTAGNIYESPWRTANTDSNERPTLTSSSAASSARWRPRESQSDSHLPRIFPRRVPDNSHAFRSLGRLSNKMRRFGDQLTFTSKLRRVDFGDCRPSICTGGFRCMPYVLLIWSRRFVSSARSGIQCKSQFPKECLARVSVRGTQSVSYPWR